MSNDADDFLLGGGVPSAKFHAIGTMHTGIITEKPVVMQQIDYVTRKPKVWDDGRPQQMLQVTVQTTERDATIENDNGIRRFYLRASSRQAVADALRAVGATGLEVGGTLTLVYTHDGVPSAAGMNPPKQFTAAYKPPASAAQQFLNEPAQQPPASTATTPPPAAPPAQFTPEQLASMQAAGIDTSRLVGA